MSNKPSLSRVTQSGLLSVFNRCGPVGRSLAREVSKGNYKALRCAHPNPNEYETSYEFGRAYLATSLARKLDCLPLNIDTRQVALTKWMETEDVCQAVNRLGGAFRFIDSTVEYQITDVICLARRLIDKALGAFSWDSVYDAATFSGGATTRLRRRSGHPFYKIQGKPHVTRRCALLAACLIWHDEPWRAAMQREHGFLSDPSNWLEVVEGARFDTVPKDAGTDRTILIEPCMNMLVQKGIGKLIRRSLRGVGIDLDDQSVNQRLAYQGSLDGSLATIDLASASDSISQWIVRELLPTPWFDACDLVRSDTAVIDGRPHVLHKFSSMGNGFTFELESLLFWGLSKACVILSGSADRRIGIFGDDIIVAADVVPLLLDVFARVGFTINREKSFWDGPFRESCGKHYFRGADVTPFYCKRDLQPVEQRLWFCNSWRNWCNQTGYIGQACYEELVQLVPHKHRLPVPAYFGSKAGLICNLDEAVPKWLRRKQQWLVSVLLPKRGQHRPNGWSAMYTTLWLYQGEVRPETRLVIEKGEVEFRLRRRSTSRWDNFDTVVFLPRHLNRNFG